MSARARCASGGKRRAEPAEKKCSIVIGFSTTATCSAARALIAGAGGSSRTLSASMTMRSRKYVLPILSNTSSGCETDPSIDPAIVSANDA